MPFYACRNWQGALAPREGQKIAWVKAQDLKTTRCRRRMRRFLPALLEIL